jgi:hypothetical protein
MAERTITVSRETSDLMGLLAAEKRLAEVTAVGASRMFDAAFTVLCKEAGITGRASFKSLDGTKLVVDVLDGETV